MKDNRYVSIDIPPYIEPELYYKKNRKLSNNRGYSSLIILSVVTLIISIGIIILGIYLGM